MPSKPLPAGLKTALEFGPILGFLVAYLMFRTDTFVFAGTEYTGFVAVTAAFVPIFLLAMGMSWFLTGHLPRIQAFTATMLVVFGGFSVWLNDPRLFKMKPTAIYSCLALILGIGLLRGQSWLKFIMEDAIPLKEQGWMILTKRMMVLFVASAVANEIVWRSQPEAVWVFFETLVMPVLVFVFFIAQIGLFVDYVTLKPSKKKPRSRPVDRA